MLAFLSFFSGTKRWQPAAKCVAVIVSRRVGKRWCHAVAVAVPCCARAARAATCARNTYQPKFRKLFHGPNVANYQDISLYLSLYASVYILVTNKFNADVQKNTLLSR